MDVRHFPPIDEALTTVDGPCQKVTLLEDRAQVRRTARVQLVAGLNRIAIADVAPTLQDVSLSAETLAGEAHVTDVRCRRAMRVWSTDQSGAVAEIEAEIESLQRALRHLTEDRARAEARHGVLTDIVAKGAEEVPTDASWGIVNQQAWRDTFDSLFSRMQALRQQMYDLYHQQLDNSELLENAMNRRHAAATTSRRFVAWLEADIVAERAGEAQIAIDYVVPSAMWRPMHRARLVGGDKLEWTSSAVVWQRTGEDWTNASLLFSTARSSLGVEPPLLSDDLLSTQRRTDQVSVEAREVKIQRAQVEGGGGPGAAADAAARELPGVDDGGDIQLLAAEGTHTVLSDGRATIVPIGRFDTTCASRLVVMAELDLKAFLEVVATNVAGRPILAGPVELVRDHGFVGWTQVMFIAANERFEVSFGPDDAVRVARSARENSEVDHVDRWRVTATLTKIFLSNLSSDPRRITVTERIPVSEVEQVRVMLLSEDSSEGAAVDDNGFVKWSVDLGPHGREQRRLAWSVAIAPDVEGLQ